MLGLTLAVAGGQCWAVDFHVTTAQELQNALTLAAANGADDTIYLAAGYYTGNFNFNSAEANSLTLQAEAGVANDQVTIDGAGTGRTMSLSCSANANVTVQGLTFLRNCGDAGNGALRIATGAGADILVDSCRFLSPTNTAGMGLEIVSGLNATVRRCTTTGAPNSLGTGVSIGGVTGNIAMENCIVNGNTASPNAGGILVSGGSVVTLSNCTVSGNTANGGYNWGDCRGGGVFVSGGSVATLSGNTISGNVCNLNGASGGGVYVSGGNIVTLSGNTFSGNTCNGGGTGGGGLSVSSGTVMLSNNTFSANSAGGGGGAACSGTTVTLTGNTFTGNSGSGASCSGTTVMFSGNTFSGNSTGGSGGGAGVGGSTVTLSGNTFSGNSSSGSGGGAYCAVSAAVTLSGNTLKENTAAYSGGGLYADGPTVTLLNNLIVRNQQAGSSYKGGGVWVRAATLDMINNTVTANSAVGSGGGVAFQVDGVTEVLHVYNNILWGNTAQGNGADVHMAGTGSRKEFFNNDAHGMFGVWDIALNNLDLAPQYFDPVNGDYHLRSTSPCINVGTNGAPSLPTVDLDGEARISGGTVDMGCYELSNTAKHPADVNGDWVISDAEYTAYAAAWKNDQPWATGPNPIPADYVTRAGYLKQNGGAYHNDGSARPVCWKPGAP